MAKTSVKPWLAIVIGLVLALIALLIKYTPWQKLERAGLQIEYNQGQGYASVFLDDQYLEKAPLAEKEIQAGDYILKIVPDDQGLAEFSTPISLEKGTLAVVIYEAGLSAKYSAATVYELHRQAELGRSGSLSVDSYPETAQLSISGQGDLTAPTTIDDLPAGDYQLSISSPGYKGQEQQLQILAGYQTKISVKLAKLDETEDGQNETNTADNSDQELATEASQAATTNQAVASQSAQVLIKNTGYFVNDQEVLRVRSASASGASELGWAVAEQTYPYLANLINDESTAWLPILFEDQTGWVSSQFAEIIHP